LVLLAGLAVSTVPAQADSIGIAFDAGDRTMASTDQPGIVGGADWNNIFGDSGTNLGLQDDSATGTSALLTFSAAGTLWPFQRCVHR